MLVTVAEITVRYAETDKMGIVHHANYAIWFEAGRVGFLKDMGYYYSDIEAMDIALPLTELVCRYKKPARFDDVLLVKTFISKMTNIRLIFGYEIYNKKDNSLLATGETHHVWTNSRLQPINISKQNGALFKILQKCI